MVTKAATRPKVTKAKPAAAPKKQAAASKKKAASKKAAPKKAAPKKAAPKKAAPKKAASKKAASKKAASKKAAPKKAASKKAAAPSKKAAPPKRAAPPKKRAAAEAPADPATTLPQARPVGPPAEVVEPPLVGIPSPPAARHRLLVDGERFGHATLSVRPLPPLRLTSGVVVACDPFEVAGPPLGRRLRAGSYDVDAAVASYPGKHGPGEQLLAAVALRISRATPVRWEPATFADARDADEPAYPTDSGAGCFMDARVQDALAAEPTTFPTASYRTLERQLLDEHHVASWGWASYTPEPSAPASCVAFLGGATASRRSYWGYDERGALACLLTDLEIFPAAAWGQDPGV